MDLTPVVVWLLLLCPCFVHLLLQQKYIGHVAVCIRLQNDAKGISKTPQLQHISCVPQSSVDVKGKSAWNNMRLDHSLQNYSNPKRWQANWYAGRSVT